MTEVSSEPQRNGFFSSASSPAQPKQTEALLEQTMAVPPSLMKDRMGTWSQSLALACSQGTHTDQQTSCDRGAGVSQLCHAVGSQGTKDFLAFAVLTVQMRIRRDTHSFAEKQSAPHMRGAQRDRDGYVVSFPQRAAAHSLHRNA